MHHNVTFLAVTKAKQLHAEIFASCSEMDIKQVSRLERERKVLPDRSFVYGEIPFETVDAIFTLVRGHGMHYNRNAIVCAETSARCAPSSGRCWIAAATSMISAQAAAKSCVVSCYCFD